MEKETTKNQESQRVSNEITTGPIEETDMHLTYRKDIAKRFDGMPDHVILAHLLQ